MTPLPMETPRELHPALQRLSQFCDLVAYADVVGQKTMYGEKPGIESWQHTRKFMKTYASCSPDDAIALLREAGADNDVEAMFHVANSQHLMP